MFFSFLPSLDNSQWNLEEEMHFYSLVSTQMLSQTLSVFMQDALLSKERNGQQRNGFTWTHLIRQWELEGTALISMKAVKDGLPLENALRILNIWLELQAFPATVGKVARHVRSVMECFPDSKWWFWMTFYFPLVLDLYYFYFFFCCGL